MYKVLFFKDGEEAKGPSILDGVTNFFISLASIHIEHSNTSLEFAPSEIASHGGILFSPSEKEISICLTKEAWEGRNMEWENDSTTA